jgi:hypothetical protein
MRPRPCLMRLRLSHIRRRPSPISHPFLILHRLFRRRHPFLICRRLLCRQHPFFMRHHPSPIWPFLMRHRPSPIWHPFLILRRLFRRRHPFLIRRHLFRRRHPFLIRRRQQLSSVVTHHYRANRAGSKMNQSQRKRGGLKRVTGVELCVVGA